MPFATPFRRFKFNSEQEKSISQDFTLLLENDWIKQLLFVRKGNVLDNEEALEIKKLIQFMLEKFFNFFVEIISESKKIEGGDELNRLENEN